jgi:carbon monoxide dehydrogenase subunit G
MPGAQRTIVINQPIGDVFAFVTDGEMAQQWRSGVIEVSKKSGDGKGAVYRQIVSGPGGRKIDADYEVTEYNAPTHMAFRAIAGPVRPVGSYDLEDVGGNTSLTFKLAADVGGWKKWVMGGQVQKTMDAEMAALDKLKSVLESTPG